MGDAPTAEQKALAIARFEAMRGTLERIDDNWRLTVRRVNEGGAIKLMSKDLVDVVEFVHQEWAPGYVEQRRSVYERASRFNVAEVTTSPDELVGVDAVAPAKLNVFAHFFDLLTEIHDDNAYLRVWFYAMQPTQWCIESREMATIRAPSLVKLCHRTDAWMHKHYVNERSSILETARELDLVGPSPPEQDPSADVLPVVVMPGSTSAPEAPRDPEPPGITPRTLVVTAVVAMTIGMVVGALAAAWLG